MYWERTEYGRNTFVVLSGKPPLFIQSARLGDRMSDKIPDNTILSFELTIFIKRNNSNLQKTSTVLDFVVWKIVNIPFVITQFSNQSKWRDYQYESANKMKDCNIGIPF